MGGIKKKNPGAEYVVQRTSQLKKKFMVPRRGCTVYTFMYGDAN